MSLLKKIEEYLAKYQDPEGKRSHLRLPVSLPVLYAFPGKERKPEYLEALSIDVSSNGIQIQIIDVPARMKKKFLKRNTRINLKVDLPKRDGLLELKGKICWNHTITESDPERFQIGIEFTPLSLDAKVELLHYALRTARIRKTKKIATTAGIALLVIAFFISGAVLISRKIIYRNYDASQKILEAMEEKAVDLAKEKIRLERELERTQRQMDKLKDSK